MGSGKHNDTLNAGEAVATEPDGSVWIPRGRTVHIAGIEIRGGLFYTSRMPTTGMDPTVIYTDSPVRRLEEDHRDDPLLPRCYGDLGSESRQVLLEWLAGPRALLPMEISPGLLSIYLYGLERRVLSSGRTMEQGEYRDVLDELLRIVPLYRDYAEQASMARRLTEWMVLRRPRCLRISYRQIVEARHQALFAIQLARLANSGRRVPAEVARDWIGMLDGHAGDGATERADDSFLETYRLRHGQGLLLAADRVPAFRPEYRPANSRFPVVRSGLQVPDVYRMAPELDELRRIAGQCLSTSSPGVGWRNRGDCCLPDPVLAPVASGDVMEGPPDETSAPKAAMATPAADRISISGEVAAEAEPGGAVTLDPDAHGAASDPVPVTSADLAQAPGQDPPCDSSRGEVNGAGKSQAKSLDPVVSDSPGTPGRAAVASSPASTMMPLRPLRRGTIIRTFDEHFDVQDEELEANHLAFLDFLCQRQHWNASQARCLYERHFGTSGTLDDVIETANGLAVRICGLRVAFYFDSGDSLTVDPDAIACLLPVGEQGDDYPLEDPQPQESRDDFPEGAWPVALEMNPDYRAIWYD